jgi:uncharacterized protein YodC (DUF2158 family)
MISTEVAKGKRFRAGETVRLNSGGPNLAVIASRDDKVTVEWQAEGETKRHTLPAACFSAIGASARASRAKV